MRSWLWAAVCAAALWYLTGCVSEEQTKITPTPHGEATTTLGKTVDRAEDSACEQYEAQLNQAVAMYIATNEAPPPDLATVIRESGLPASELANCKYTYDPATGRVALLR
ncbi:MAG TPA: hypothetical protein DCZ72_04325 [Armatimonadetes bacterium]|nr:hypothetical protein [Armatimonadota bacterium]